MKILANRPGDSVLLPRGLGLKQDGVRIDHGGSLRKNLGREDRKAGQEDRKIEKTIVIELRGQHHASRNSHGSPLLGFRSQIPGTIPIRGFPLPVATCQAYTQR